MDKKLVRHGNSSAIVIDKTILELLNITRDTELKISTDGQAIIIKPKNLTSNANIEGQLKDKVRKVFEEILHDYAPTWEALSKQ